MTIYRLKNKYSKSVEVLVRDNRFLFIEQADFYSLSNRSEVTAISPSSRCYIA